MPMKMVRRPQAVRRIHPEVIREVNAAHKILAQASVSTLAGEISDWDHQPDFDYDVKTTRKQWTFVLKWDRRTKAGKIYEWVSAGTGERGDDPAGTSYVIVPKKAKALRFFVPLVTKTTADGGMVAPSTTWDPGIISAQSVTAPGIFPRHLGKELYTHLRSRKSGSFHNVTEAAIKRAFRKLGIYVG